MVLLGYGEFRFSMETFSYESFERKLEANIQAVNIIGGRPSLHKMGLGVETVNLESTFHPYYLPNNGGLAQVSAMRAAVGRSMPLVALRSGFADITGNWVLKSLGEKKTEIHPSGEGQVIVVNMELQYDGGGSRGLALMSSVFNLFG
jgi:phage protein U